MSTKTLASQQEIVDWAIEKIKSFETQKKIYNLSAIILSLLDVVCGVITIFYASMLTTSIVASILCGTTWGARYIQVVKIEKLTQALKYLKVANTFSLLYIMVRKRRSEFMTNVKVRNIVIGILTILGFASVIVCHFVPALVEYVDYAIYVLCAVLPADLYAVFNNAKLSAEEVENKVQAKQLKVAEAQAKQELAEKQDAELKALAEKKLVELQSQQQNTENK